MTEAEQRILVRDITRRWVGTPYHHRAAIQGVGVDCARILIEVFAEAGLIERFDPGKYTRDWHLHRGEERYLETIERYSGPPVREDASIASWGDHVPPIGDILVWRVGRTFSHSAIVTAWPFVVHASAPSRVVEEVSVLNTPVFRRPVRQYSVWGAA